MSVWLTVRRDDPDEKEVPIYSRFTNLLRSSTGKKINRKGTFIYQCYCLQRKKKISSISNLIE